jgi:hypothetical protein
MTNNAQDTSQPFSHEFLDLLEDEMRSAVLKMSLLDGKLAKLSEGEMA